MAFAIPSVEFSAVSGRRFECPAKIAPWSVRKQTVLKKNGRVGLVRVRVSSRIKGLEVGVPDLSQNVGLYGQFSAPVKPSTASSPKRSKEDEEKQNYHLSMGYAIRTLRDEFPELFYRELSFDIYRDDIVFKDPLNTFFGIENYKSIFWALRFHGRIFFRALWVDIIRVWQPDESVIMVRWTIHGIPRVPWESHGRFDGTSEYKLDKNGKIYEHQVHNIVLNAPPKFRVLSVDDLIQSIGCPSTPNPTYFEMLPSWITNFWPSKLTWFRGYLTSVFSLAQKLEAGPSRRS
ncbi:uncharacterized protein LOC127814282 [Diospyros lotus]|uniref:uncharacterized protein LOC127814282 n=1 Tax=Diospyros lotus TaxID=55363 RepID=UPI002252DF97|nr:uncharacterized protein LOC127814282 [Diospyros lotus]